MKKVILFDFDDTIVQTKKCKSDALAEMGKQMHGDGFDESAIERYWGLPYQEFLKKLFLVEDSSLPSLIENYRKISARYPLYAFPQASQTLEFLSSNYSLGIITATSRFAVESQLKDLNIDTELFAFIQTADESSHHKPDPRVFDKAFAWFEQNYGDSRFIYVGDSIRDYEAARGAGLSFLAIAESTTATSVWEENSVEYVKRFADIPGVVEKFFIS